MGEPYIRKRYMEFVPILKEVGHRLPEYHNLIIEVNYQPRKRFIILMGTVTIALVPSNGTEIYDEIYSTKRFFRGEKQVEDCVSKLAGDEENLTELLLKYIGDGQRQ